MAKVSGSDLPDRLPETEEEEEALARGEVALLQTATTVFDPDTIREVSTFDEALDLALGEYGELVDASDEIGTGVELVNKDKDSLIGVKLVILELRYNESDIGEFVSALAVTEHGRKVVINDGSEGIYKQLKTWSDRTGRRGGLLVKAGLRRSDYKKEVDGKLIPATTYYLNV